MGDVVAELQEHGGDLTGLTLAQFRHEAAAAWAGREPAVVTGGVDLVRQLPIKRKCFARAARVAGCGDGIAQRPHHPAAADLPFARRPAGHARRSLRPAQANRSFEVWTQRREGRAHRVHRLARSLRHGRERYRLTRLHARQRPVRILEGGGAKLDRTKPAVVAGVQRGDDQHRQRGHDRGEAEHRAAADHLRPASADGTHDHRAGKQGHAGQDPWRFLPREVKGAERQPQQHGPRHLPNRSVGASAIQRGEPGEYHQAEGNVDVLAEHAAEARRLEGHRIPQQQRVERERASGRKRERTEGAHAQRAGRGVEQLLRPEQRQTDRVRCGRPE